MPFIILKDNLTKETHCLEKMGNIRLSFWAFIVFWLEAERPETPVVSS